MTGDNQLLHQMSDSNKKGVSDKEQDEALPPSGHRQRSLGTNQREQPLLRGHPDARSTSKMGGKNNTGQEEQEALLRALQNYKRAVRTATDQPNHKDELPGMAVIPNLGETITRDLVSQNWLTTGR